MSQEVGDATDLDSWALTADRLTDPGCATADILRASAQPLDLASLRTVPDGPVGGLRHLCTTTLPAGGCLAWTGAEELLLAVLDGRVEVVEPADARRPNVRLLGEGQSLRLAAGATAAVRVAGTARSASVLLVHAAAAPPADRPDLVPLVLAVEHVPDYYYGYAERYAAVYAAGGDTWEPSEPNEVLVRALQHLPAPPCEVVDLGCGEGRDAVYLASLGFAVTAVDVARAALDKGRERARAMGVRVRFLERDVVYLDGLPRGAFDVALNMGCLHMIPDEALRAAHLRGVYELLRPGGSFLLAHCRDHWLQGFYSVPDYETVGPVVPGRVIPRRIRLREGGTAMLPLPLVPYKESQLPELSAELAAAGLEVEQDLSGETAAFGNTVVLLARRP